MPGIRKEFTYAVPNEWHSDDFSQGKTATYIYEGPEYLTLEVDAKTGEEVSWVLYTPEEQERPTAADVLRITIDCKDNPMLCDIINDQGTDIEPGDDEMLEIKYEAPPGYEPIEVPTDLKPRDIYDEFNVRYNFETQEFDVPVRTWKTIEKVDPDLYTWDHFRSTRNKILAQSDGQMDDDLPEDFKRQWKEYRQLLRDAPTNLGHIPPFFAEQMLPDEPSFEPDDADLEIGEEDYRLADDDNTNI